MLVELIGEIKQWINTNKISTGLPGFLLLQNETPFLRSEKNYTWAYLITRLYFMDTEKMKDEVDSCGILTRVYQMSAKYEA